VTTAETRRSEKVEQAKQRRAEAREELARMIARLADSDEWRAWLDCRATFHDYSLNNVLMILSQKPDASQVAGFKAWQKVGRQVRKGEKSIRIWAPMLVQDRDSDDPDARRMLFRLVPVFDVEQTDGDPLPEPPREPITGDSHAPYLDTLTEYARRALGYTVETVEAGELGAAKGTCNPTKKVIRLADAPANAMVRTLLHELAHAHGIHYQRPDGSGYPRDVAEVIVESAAYVAAGAIGLDTSGESVSYVAGWADGDVEKLRDVAEMVDVLASRLEVAAGISTKERNISKRDACNPTTQEV
jgi:antirestriction protein ArdC